MQKCPGCGKEVAQTDPETVRAYDQDKVTTFWHINCYYNKRTNG